jgi:lipopolysaccharide transport system permease protein
MSARGICLPLSHIIEKAGIFRPKHMWNGDRGFLLHNLIAKDFKVRYRNMSLGMFWSLLNPLVTMGVLTVVFTTFMPNPAIKHYPLFFLCGLIPYNFFVLAWSTGTSSLSDNANLIKRVAVPREIIPIATVLGNSLHLLIQVALLLVFALFEIRSVNRYWLWLPLIWTMEVALLCGLSLISSAVNVYVRDTRYVVESFNAVLFWLVPIVYQPPPQYSAMFALNPVAALVVALRDILMYGKSPAASLLTKLSIGSVAVLVLGLVLFRRMRQGFYDYL